MFSYFNNSCIVILSEVQLYNQEEFYAIRQSYLKSAELTQQRLGNIGMFYTQSLFYAFLL
jgi:hypothetical protein